MNRKRFSLNWRYINELDQEKAAKLAEFERDLNVCQEQILEAARKRIDSVNEEANRLKMNILKEAQAKANSKIEEITEKVAQVWYYNFFLKIEIMSFFLF